MDTATKNRDPTGVTESILIVYPILDPVRRVDTSTVMYFDSHIFHKRIPIVSFTNEAA
jgi:hypothetical protein